MQHLVVSSDVNITHESNFEENANKTQMKFYDEEFLFFMLFTFENMRLFLLLLSKGFGRCAPSRPRVYADLHNLQVISKEVLCKSSHRYT